MLTNLDEKYKRLFSLAMVIFGNCIYALSVKLFVLPANLISCGTTGLSMVVNHYLHIPMTAFIFCFNGDLRQCIFHRYLLGSRISRRYFLLTCPSRHHGYHE